jgi:cytochrome P450
LDTTAATSATLFRPPAPPPLRRSLDLFEFLRAIRANPLTTWGEEHFENAIVAGDGALGRITVLNDPAAIRHVLVDNAGNYRKDDLQRRVLAPGRGEGMLMAEGDEWKLQRRLVAPLFVPRHLERFLPGMAQAAERLVRRWRRRDGRVVDVVDEMTRVILDVLERTIFTSGLKRDHDALARAFARYFEVRGTIDPLDVFGMPAWLPRIGQWRARRAIRFFEEVVEELIESRRGLMAGGEAPPQDLLTLLLEAADPDTGQGLSDVEVRANIVFFIAAGHETTADALSWALYLVSQAPEVRRRLEREVDEAIGPAVAPREVSGLVFTRAVLEEAMRLYPPVPYLSRAALRDDRIGKFKIPKGSMVVVAPWVLHRHRRLWQDPDAFDPDRFMPGRREAIDRFAYLPFGAGPRVCMGAGFAVQQASVVLASVVRAARLDLATEHPVFPVHRVTLRPQGGLPMRLTLRGRDGGRPEGRVAAV